MDYTWKSPSSLYRIIIIIIYDDHHRKVLQQWNTQRGAVEEEEEEETNEKISVKNQKMQKHTFKALPGVKNYIAIVNNICSSCWDTVARGQRHHVSWRWWQGIDSHCWRLGIYHYLENKRI